MSLPAEGYAIRPIGVVRSAITTTVDDCWARIGLRLGFLRSGQRIGRIGSASRFPKSKAWTGCACSVRERDAIDGTPVVDIKPYVQEFGPREPVRQSAWSRELIASYFKPAK